MWYANLLGLECPFTEQKGEPLWCLKANSFYETGWSENNSDAEASDNVQIKLKDTVIGSWYSEENTD